ncbi:ATP-binding protein [Candidatus Woesearchaeota archaeon]|nr:ATP-binding protein [Candidatus Woesearchaeota archaeon]
MTYDIIIGRNEADRKLFKEKGTVFIGKQYVKMGQTTSLSNRVYLDVARTHVMMICGKRGSGKSYSAGVIAEEMAKLPKEIKERITVLFFDTMGVFLTMKFPNTRQDKLLYEWGLRPEALEIKVFTPEGFFDEYKRKGIPADERFSLKTSELDAGDWCNVFDVRLTEPVGTLIERVIGGLRKEKEEYSIGDIKEKIRQDQKEEQRIKNAAENRFVIAEAWGLFDAKGTTVEELMQPGSVNVLDISAYTNITGNWSIKGLVIGIISKKLLQERIRARKEEEMEEIRKEKSHFYEEKKEEKPMVWLILDEAHEFLTKEEKTPASDALVQLLREGRQPGISMVLITQQPGEIHKDVLTQSDIVLSHKLTAKQDIEALNGMMQSYVIADLQEHLNDLPKQRGAAIILDDNSERIYPVAIRPKRSWHGGEAPSALKIKKGLEASLGLK